MRLRNVSFLTVLLFGLCGLVSLSWYTAFSSSRVIRSATTHPFPEREIGLRLLDPAGPLSNPSAVSVVVTVCERCMVVSLSRRRREVLGAVVQGLMAEGTKEPPWPDVLPSLLSSARTG